MVRQIGDLPHVSHFNYSIRSGLYSFEFQEYTPEICDLIQHFLIWLKKEKWVLLNYFRFK